MILGVALISEVVILLIFDLGVLSHQAGTNISTAMLNPLAAFNGFDAFKNGLGNDLGAGAAAIGLFFAFWSWVGFEMAPNYGEESRDPKRIVPLVIVYFGDWSRHFLYHISWWHFCLSND